MIREISVIVVAIVIADVLLELRIRLQSRYTIWRNQREAIRGLAAARGGLAGGEVAQVNRIVPGNHSAN